VFDAKQLSNVGLSIGVVVLEEASDLAIGELFDPVRGLVKPVVSGDEKVTCLAFIADEAGRRGRLW
jgi:hypothetical protein